MMRILERPALAWAVIIAADSLFGWQKWHLLCLLYLAARAILREYKKQGKFSLFSLAFLVFTVLCGFFALTNII